MSQSGGFHLSHRFKPVRWSIFISGRGSNLAASLEAVQEVNSNRIELVVATSTSAAGCAKAARAGIPVLICPLLNNGKIDWEQLSRQLEIRKIDLILLLGFMKIVPKKFIDRWANRIVNLHPSLLPKYPGLNSIERAYSANDEMGASLHLVVPEIDAGKVLKRRRALENPNRGFALPMAEFRVHLEEQRLVKEVVQQAPSLTQPPLKGGQWTT